MENRMKLSKFTLSDDTEQFEGYTDGTNWGKWANVCFSREQLIEFLGSTPYDFRFDNDGEVPIVLVYWEKNENPELIQSTPLPTDNGEILEGYFLDLEFMEVEE